MLNVERWVYLAVLIALVVERFVLRKEVKRVRREIFDETSRRIRAENASRSIDDLIASESALRASREVDKKE